MLAVAGALPPVEPERGGEAAENAAIGRSHGDGRVDRRAEQGAERADVGIDADGGVDGPLPGGDIAHRVAFGEAGQGEVDETASRAAEPAMVEPQGGGGAGAHILDHDVGLRRAVAADAPRRLVLEVQPDQALAAVEQRVDGVAFAAGPHDLDHVRPLVGQQHRGDPAGPARAEIEDADPRKRRPAIRCIGRHVFLPPAKPSGPAADSVPGGGRRVQTGVGEGLKPSPTVPPPERMSGTTSCVPRPTPSSARAAVFPRPGRRPPSSL